MLRVSSFVFAILIYSHSPTLVVDTARILGVFPIPSISHQVVFRALMQELANRGHELVIITPNPALPKERPPDNVTEIDTGEAYENMKQMILEAHEKRILKRGVIMDIDLLFSRNGAKCLSEMITYQFNLPQVKNLLNNKSEKFDLVFVEAISNYHLIVSHLYKAPTILFSSFYGFPEQYEAMGALARHPLFYPNFYRLKFRNLSMWEKIEAIYLEWKIFRMAKETEDLEDKELKERFGPDTPTIEELKNNVQMLFVNSHPLFGDNRPVPPSVLYLGALHLKPVNALPQDLKTYLDNSQRGVVYVSLGTNVHTAMMDQDLVDAFLNAIAALPYDCLWKYNGDQAKEIPKNLKIQTWFPQRDLLMHPNIKVFVTQGGLQSTDEAIDAEVPLVGIPMLGDQWYNVNKYVQFGIGEQVDAITMTADDLVKAVTTVIGNDSYRQNIKRLRAVMRDQPQTSLERAVWWTEHVLRRGGEHLRAPNANVRWADYYMSDVILTVLAIGNIVVLLVVIGTCYLLFKLRKLISKTVEKLKKT